MVGAVRTRLPRGAAPDRILDAAARLLSTGGGHIEVDQLAGEVGCSVGAIYHHFGSKAGVLAVVVGRYNETISRLIVPERTAETRPAWLDGLRAHLDAVVEAMWRDPLTAVIVAETIKDASAAAETERWLRLHVGRLATHLAEAQAQGHLPADCDAEVLAAGMAGGFRQIMRVYIGRERRPALATVKAGVWGFIAALLAQDAEP